MWRSYFERIFPGQVEQASMVRDYGRKGRKALAEHFQWTEKLEAAVLKQRAKGGEPTTRCAALLLHRRRIPFSPSPLLASGLQLWVEWAVWQEGGRR